jgi:predicted DNA-binding transcriptional regulator AlpA/DNA-binding XRE family transcriptional regulator
MDNTSPSKSIGGRVAEHRKRTGLTIAAVATAVNLTVEELTAAENGHGDLPISALDRLSSVFGVPFASWFADAPRGEVYLSVRQAADKAGVSVGTLANWRVMNNKGIAVGPKWFKLTPQIVRYAESDVDSWIEAQRQGASA